MSATPAPPEPALEPEPGAPSGADQASCGSSCQDPHDHAGHDHGPTGAEIVQGLTRGFGVLSLAVPALAIIMLAGLLAAPPSTPLVLLLGVILGGAQLLVLVAASLVAAKGSPRLAVNPGLTAVRGVLDEVLRLAAVLAALVLWPADARGPLGLWVGAGCALVWLVLTTLQLLSARRRIISPSPWSEEMVATLLVERVSVRRSMTIRMADVLGLVLFQLGATVLVSAAPVMVVATAILAVGTGLSTLVLQRRAPSERIDSPWALVPLGIGILTALLAAIASLSV